MNRLKTVIKIVIFIGILVGILFVLNIIFKAKWIDTTFPTTTTIDGFYDEPEKSIDIIYLGSSHMMSGISPIEVWKDTGLTGYTCGSTKLSVPSTYLYLKEAIKTKQPKVAVMDVSRIFKSYDNEYYEEDTRRSLDYIRPSRDKWEVASFLMEGDERQSLISYVFPIIRYHSRWTDLKEEDFTYIFQDKHMESKGQNINFSVSRFALPENFLDVVQEDEGYAIDHASIMYFEKMVAACEENHVQLVLIKIPCYSWNKTKHEIATDLAKVYEVPFIDYNMPDLMRKIDFVSTEDFQDEGDHLNSFGAKKVSEHLGRYIAEHYIKDAVHTQEVCSVWNRDVEYYELLLEDAELDRCANLIDYLEMLDNENYIAAVAARFDAAYCITPEVITAMRELGLAANLEGKYKASYSAIVESGETICEGIDLEDEVSLYFHDLDEGIEIDTLSQGADFGNVSSIIINGKEYSENQTGLTFVVYDKRINQVVSTKRFNTHSKQYHFGTELVGEGILRNFLDLLSNENYVAFIETKGNLTDKQFSELSQWVNHNSDYTMERTESECTAMICEAGNVSAFQQAKEVQLSYEDAESDISVVMHGVCSEEKEFASIKVNGKGKSRNETGINVVVCDKRSGAVVCRKVF